MTGMDAMKRKSITLKYVPVVKTWEVLTVVNSAQLYPSNLINENYLKVLCADENWDVTVVKLDIHIPIPSLPLPIPLGAKAEDEPVLGPPSEEGKS